MCHDIGSIEASFTHSGGSRISPRRGRQLPGGAPTYEFAKFHQKLHEIDEFGPPGRGARPLHPLLDPLLTHNVNVTVFQTV